MKGGDTSYKRLEAIVAATSRSALVFNQQFADIDSSCDKSNSTEKREKRNNGQESNADRLEYGIH